MRVFRGREALYDPPVEATLFNAPALAVINIDLTNGDKQVESEYERILSAVTPLLDGVPLHALEENAKTRDITFLAGETGIAAYQLAHFGVAQKLAAAHKIAAEFFYALLAENTLLKASLSGATGVRFDIDLATDVVPLFYDIVLLPADTITKAVRAAIADHFVPRSVERLIKGILQQLARSVAEAETYVRDQQPKVLFDHVQRFLAAGKHEQVLDILQQDSFGDLPGLLQRLQEAAAFTDPANAKAAATSAALSDVLGYDEQIIEHIRNEQGIKRPEDVRELARLNRADWGKLLRKTASSATVGDHPIRKSLIDLHASALVRKLEKRFPTTAFAAQLERDKTAAPEHRNQLLGLLDEHPDFDLATGNIDLLLKARLQHRGRRRDPMPNGRNRHSRPCSACSSSRRPIARRRRCWTRACTRPPVSTRWVKHASSTRSAPAAHSLARRRTPRIAKPPTFTPPAPCSRVSFRARPERCTCRRSVLPAAGTTRRGDEGLSEHQESVPAGGLLCVQGMPHGAQRRCLCRGYAAIPEEPARGGFDAAATCGHVKIAKDVLFERRPDLGDTDLNCDNTNTPVSYIDVVCELLEDAVAPDPGIAFTGTSRQRHRFRCPARDFAGERASVYGSGSRIRCRLSGNRVVRDKKVVCKLSPAGGANQWIARRLRQTYGTARGSRRRAGIRKPAAYDALSSSTFAFKLPFDLFHQEARGYFAQFDVARADLMRALTTAAGPQDYEIAAEALGLSDEERQLIGTAHATAADQNVVLERRRLRGNRCA